MRLLKYSLWAILIACLLWGAIILVAPSLLTSVLSRAYGGAVTIHRLSISPKLDMSAALIKFSVPSPFSGVSEQVTVRGVNLDWNFEENFDLSLTAGSISFGKLRTLDSLSARIEPASLFDWSTLMLKSEFANYNIGDFAVGPTQVNAEVSPTLLSINSAEVFGHSATLNIAGDKFLIPEFHAQLGSIDLTKFPHFQNFEARFVTGSQIKSSNVVIDNANAILRMKEDQSEFALTLQNLNYRDRSTLVDRIIISSKTEAAVPMLGDAWFVDASSVHSEQLGAQLSQYNGVVELTETGFDHRATAQIEKLALTYGPLPIGELSDVHTDITLTSRLLRSGSLLTQFSVLVPLRSDINAKISGDVSISANQPQLCLLDTCAVEDANISYRLETKNAALFGNSVCTPKACDLTTMHHTIQTDDTDAFFGELGASGLLSPIAFPMLYFNLNQGKQLDEGHILEF